MFNQENTDEQMVLDTLCGGGPSNMVAEEPACCGNRNMISAQPGRRKSGDMRLP
jgi:hypothetical protein